jgi:hypothetical protein
MHDADINNLRVRTGKPFGFAHLPRRSNAINEARAIEEYDIVGLQYQDSFILVRPVEKLKDERYRGIIASFNPSRPLGVEHMAPEQVMVFRANHVFYGLD